MFNETIWTLRNRKPCSKERRGDFPLGEFWILWLPWCWKVWSRQFASLGKLANQDFHQIFLPLFFVGVRLDSNLFIPQEVCFNIKTMVFLFHKSLMVGPLNHCLRMFELNRTSPKPSSAAKWHCGGPINEPKSIDTGHKILKCWYMKYICLVVRSLLLYLFKRKWQFSPSGTFRRIRNINWWTPMKNGGKLRKQQDMFGCCRSIRNSGIRFRHVAMSVQLGDGPTRPMAQEGSKLSGRSIRKHLNHLKPENLVEKDMTNDGLPWILPTLHLDELSL